jgi:hypothetical protein
MFLLALFVSFTTSYPLGNSDLPPSVAQRYEGPMTDAHAHPVERSVEWMLKTVDTYRKAGVEKAIFMDGSAVLQASRLRPSEIIPSIDEGYANRTGTVKHLETSIKQGFKWVGEVALRHWGQGWRIPADDPVAVQIYRLCAKYQIPITIHQDSAEYGGAYEELDRALDLSPDTVFVFHGWWLGGEHLTIWRLEKLIVDHPNLFVELAGELEASPGPPWTEQTFLGGTNRDPFAYPDGRIREEWFSLFEKYPDRFINGFDLFTESAYKFESIKTRVDYWRNLLGQLNQGAAEKIAYKNVEDILAHRVNLTTRAATVAATSAIEGANASIGAALAEGRIEGLDRARSLLLNATRAFESGDYHAALAYAQEAKEIADSAAHPQAYYEARELLLKALDLEKRASAEHFTCPEAQQLIQRAKSAYSLAAAAFVKNDYAATTHHAKTAVRLFEEAFSVEQNYPATLEAQQRQTSSHILIGAISALIIVVAVYTLRRKTRRAGTA